MTRMCCREYEPDAISLVKDGPTSVVMEGCIHDAEWDAAVQSSSAIMGVSGAAAKHSTTSISQRVGHHESTTACYIQRKALSKQRDITSSCNIGYSLI